MATTENLQQEAVPEEAVQTRQRARALRLVLPIFTVHILLVFTASAIWQHYFGTLSRTITADRLGVFIAGFSHWDATWFLEIARYGYMAKAPNETAFFPLYPILEGGLGRIVAWLAHGRLVVPSDRTLLACGIFISNVCFLLFLWLLYQVGRVKWTDRQTRRGLWLLALFPSSYYFSAAYSESLFLCLVAAAFLLGYRKRWVWAGICTALATLSWDFGPFVVFSLLWLLWKQYREDGRLGAAVQRACAVALVPLAALLAYLGWQAKIYGDPLMFLHAETHHWHRHFTWIWTSLHLDYQQDPVGFLASITFLALLIFAIRRIPFEQWLFSAVALVIPLLSTAGKYPMSMVRFVLVLFPLFLFLGSAMRKAETYVATLAVCVVLLTWLTGLFASGHWIA
ncbi:MAG: hypothetical protein K6T78_02960 [Alicyclobacillus sp.]|nr:hypothetical protein [Alicyclobacillus sp.]